MENVDKITQVHKIAAECMRLVKPYTVTRLMQREIEKPQMEIGWNMKNTKVYALILGIENGMCC